MENKEYSRRETKGKNSPISAQYTSQISQQYDQTPGRLPVGSDHDVAEIRPAAPIVQVSGSHREMGQQIGQACKLQVTRSIENAHSLITGAFHDLQLTWEGAKIQARKYLPFAQEKYPKYVEELVGMAEGAEVSFDDIMVVNAMEAVTTDA